MLLGDVQILKRCTADEAEILLPEASLSACVFLCDNELLFIIASCYES